MNEVDKFRIRLTARQYSLSECKNAQKSYIQVIKTHNNDLILTVSGKIVATQNSMQGITRNNIDVVLKKFKNETGIIVTEDNLLNARLSWVDIKKDITFSGNLSDKISLFRELSYKNTSKNEICVYKSPIGFEYGLLIKSTCKTIKDSLTVYNKLKEIRDNKNKDIAYYNSFDKAFLSSLKNILRFERRIQNANNLRKALHLDKKHIVTLKDILYCPYDLVKEKVEENFGIEL